MNDLLLAAVDQVPFILAVCEGPDLRVLALSAATRAVLPGREYVGVPIRDVVRDLVGQQIVDAYYEVNRTGVPIEGQEWRVHLDMPDGSVHEMYANFTITPWLVDDERRGVIGVGFDVTAMVRERQAAAEQAKTLQRRYEQSRDVVRALQRELLPAGLPVLPGAQIAASYLLADAGTAAGGDWFDAVARHDGRLALMVGDVVGHGVTASGVMGQLRAVLQDRLHEGADLVEALTAADRFATRVPAAHAATVCLVLLDPASGDLSYCTAGHPPPLLLAGDGTRYLPLTGGAPLGTGGSFPAGAAHLSPGDVLLLYSDGIVERPGRTHASAQAELAQIAADSAAGRALRDPGMTPAERVCAQTVELLVRATGHSDDITLLAVQRVPVPAPLALDLPAAPSELRVARQALGGWLSALGIDDQDAFILQHAVGELLTNAIEHAFDQSRPRESEAARAAAATVSLRVALAVDGAVEATVVDHGSWREPERQPIRGRGLALTAQLVDSLKVEPGAHGTVARVRHTLVRPARLLDLDDHHSPAARRPARGPAARGPAGSGRAARSTASSGPAASDPGAEPSFRITELPGGDEARVRVEGPLDSSTATIARQDLLRRSRGGTVPMSVDLSDVTLLSSAGVSALHQVAQQHTDQKATLTLHARPGSTAQAVLTLVALPHLTTSPPD